MKTFSLIFILILAFPVQATNDFERKNKAPIESYILAIDGISHEVILNNLEEIQIENKKHVLKLIKSNTRVFDFAGAFFEFDAKMYFSYEEISPGVDHWSLDGNNAAIIVQKYSDKVDFDELTEALNAQYSQMKAEIKMSETELVVDSKLKKGRKLDIDLGEIKIEQHIFYFSNKQSCVLIILQDTPLDSGDNSLEFERIKKLMQATLSVNI
ncbi:hypothetical protein SAMN03080615_00029 [Amphritea atlantica]|uniref:Uncharacterized protein n=1 Tax=Amphritea atlantica TaxID=355243 RepID=A0A1H9CKE5_9GAMM|nr:hypothetical protein [Amphritea atlantica]SEQ01690.1 hypothetical protein SAMN03080615_00029 [Amphritea atlantica]